MLIGVRLNGSSFKSCPREGASFCVQFRDDSVLVSSHAPVRGHPHLGLLPLRPHAVSSHAPVRGHHEPKRTVRACRVFQVMPP